LGRRDREGKERTIEAGGSGRSELVKKEGASQEKKKEQPRRT
jgi:hypothetical protein